MKLLKNRVIILIFAICGIVPFYLHIQQDQKKLTPRERHEAKQKVIKEVMEVQFKKYQELKKKELNSNPSNITLQLMQQLPTIFVSGAKKCGTKTLMRFFGHHPQIIRGTISTKTNLVKAHYRITRSAFQKHGRHAKRHGILPHTFVDTLDSYRAVYQQQKKDKGTS